MALQLLPEVPFATRLAIFALAWGIVAAGGIIVIRLTSRPREGEEADRCGKCGYAVETLRTFICPECGSDMRDVGLLPAKDEKIEHKRYLQFLVISIVAVIVAFWITN